MGGREYAFTHAGGADGFTNLYSSITAEPKIMLSTIHDRNMEITIKATSAIIPRIEEINSNFLHPSALLMNRLNLLWAFQYWISLWYASSSPSVRMCSMTPIKSAVTDDGC